MPDIWMDVDATLTEVPVNVFPLIDDSDFKTRETSVAYDAAGMDLVWNFVTTAGAMSQTAVTPTTGGGDYDWASQGDAMYSIKIPASGGASINNDTEGFGWFSGICTGVLAWRGPVIGFRAAGLNDKMIDSAYSATRGLAGTALPDAAADAAGGLPISDAGGLDLDLLASLIRSTDHSGNIGSVQLDGYCNHVIWLIDKQAGLIASGDITAGTYNVVRNRAGSFTTLTSGAAWSKTNGAIFATIQAASADLQAGDIVIITPVGDTTYTINGKTVYAQVSCKAWQIETVQSRVDAIAGDVENIDGKVPAEAGDEMNLADDAITSAKYDESSAFPVKSADSGATQIARTGADGDTLETLSDEIAASSAPTVEEIDAQLSATHTAGSWASGGVTGANTVTVTIEDQVNDPIPDAVIRLLNSDETVLLDVKTTDVNGQVVFELDNGSYTVRIRKAGYSFDNPETLEVSGTTSTTYDGELVTPSLLDPDLQDILVDVTDYGLDGTDGATITATPIGSNQAISGRIISSQILTGITVAGRLWLSLAKTGKFRITGYYDSVQFLTKTITVSDEDSANLADDYV